MPAPQKSRSFLSHAGTYAIGNAARRIVGFAMLPIYTRFLSPADYGVIGLLTFALALLEPLFGARLGMAIPKFYFDASDRVGKRAVIWSALGMTGVVSAVTMTVLIMLRGAGSEILFGDRKYALALGLFAVNLLTRPLESTGMTYIRLRERSRLYFGISMSKLALQVALNILLVVYWNEGVVGAVLSGMISSIVLSAALIAYVSVHEPPAFDWRLTRQMLKFCWPLWLSGLAGLYVGSSGGVYVRTFAALSDVGRLELALKFAAVAGMLIWTPFSMHWGPKSYQYYKEAEGKRKFQVAFIGISTLMFSAGLGISIFSQPVIRLMAAKPFYAAAALVPLLTLGFILNTLKSFFNFSFLITKRTEIQSLCQYVTAIVITVAYVILIPRFGILGAAEAQCFAYVTGFIYIRLVSRRYYDPGYNVPLIATFALIGSVGYVCSNILLQPHSLKIDLLIKLIVLLICVGLMAVMAIRSIRVVDTAAFEGLPWPLNRLGRLAFDRTSGT